jgi:hypothetical protein
MNCDFLVRQLTQDFHAWNARHREIQQQDVGFEFVCQRDRFFAI